MAYNEVQIANTVQLQQETLKARIIIMLSIINSQENKWICCSICQEIAITLWFHCVSKTTIVHPPGVSSLKAV